MTASLAIKALVIGPKNPFIELKTLLLNWCGLLT